jgi:DUF1680 family protein
MLYTQGSYVDLLRCWFTKCSQVVGYASRFDVTHDADGRAAVDHFFQALTQHHSYATGGNNDHVSEWLQVEYHAPILGLMPPNVCR